jgi:protein-disulfide isomerase
MHDLLYETQQQWSSSSDPSLIFNQYAKQLGLNEAQFKKDYASSKVNDRINADVAAGTKLKITGTPTFFVNGKQIQIDNSLAGFQKVIDDAIAKQAASTTAGTPTKQ